jgi:membrane-associated protein
MGTIANLIDLIVHLDKHLVQLVSQYGLLSYAILFLIIFAETGLVVTPFLPGDSLLFVAGAITAIGSLNIYLVVALLIVAAILGDSVNYWVGRKFGLGLAHNPRVPFINQGHIDKTEQFFNKHGAKTIVLARFIPIVRTFAPFIAGLGKMNYRKFLFYNVIGGVVWISSFTFAGYFFGNIPAVKKNFHYVIIAIIFLSLFPAIYEYVRAKRAPQKAVPKPTSANIEESVNK